jgi:hypothetical protein
MPTLLLDLSPAFMEALRKVAPKQRPPRIAYVLAAFTAVAVYTLYVTFVPVMPRRAKGADIDGSHGSNPLPTANAALALPSTPTDSEQNVCPQPSAPSAAPQDAPDPAVAAPSAMVADPNPSNAPRKPHRRAPQ